MYVGREVGAPREGDAGVGTIREVPRGEVVRGLQTVFGMCIGGTAVEREIEPAVAETQRDIGREVVGVGDIAVGHRRTVEVDIST